jgi:antirestriction protein
MERQPRGAGPEPTGTAHHEHKQSREVLRGEGPRIYVASLSDYNAGILHGEWIEADQNPEDVQEAVLDMLAKSPSDQTAVEFAIHDFEGFGPYQPGEYDSLDWISWVARGVTEHGLAFAAWASECDLDEDRLAHFEEAYLGEWDSLRAYAEELLDDLGYTEIVERAVPDSLRHYVKLDYQQFARDLQLGGDVSVVGKPAGGIWLFQADV